MKLMSAEQTRQWDEFTIKNEPISAVDLMERASRAFAEWFKMSVPDDQMQMAIHIFCGTGNNGGDGLAIARLLAQDHFQVYVYLVKFSDRLSPDAQVNYDRLKGMQDIPILEINEGDDLPDIPSDIYLLDALFGTGLNRPVSGYWATLFEHLNNQYTAIRVSVDMPAGLFVDQPINGAVFQADYTCTFQRPKLCFFLPETGSFVGQWEVLDIGLHPDFEDQITGPYQYLTSEAIQDRLHIRPKFGHKGTFGHALIVAGSYGKMGAAQLTAKACLRAGSGLVSVHIPKCGYEIMQIGLPEAMVVCDSHQFILSEVENLWTYKAFGIGPGIGTNSLTERAMYDLIQGCSQNLVIDADGINILAKNFEWFVELPINTILTPHPKEFERLVGTSNNDFDRLQQLQNLAMETDTIVILKGAHTAIADPEGNIYFNTTGNPGMGTGGSGDVLTGIITGLLAQDYAPIDAAVVGVYLHGLAGDIAAEDLQQESLLASDLIKNLGKSFARIRGSV